MISSYNLLKDSVDIKASIRECILIVYLNFKDKKKKLI